MIMETITDYGVGPAHLLAGDTNIGFFGEVSSDLIITGDSLAKMIGLTAGTSQFTDEPWLKFIRHGKVLFVAKRCYRFDLSWDDIQACNAVFGTRILNIRDRYYTIRLIKGSSSDPAKWDNRRSDAYNDPLNSHGSEWNDLMYPIHWSDPPSQHTETYNVPFDSDIVDLLRSELTYNQYQHYFGDGIFERSLQEKYELKQILSDSTFKIYYEGLKKWWKPYTDYEITVANWYGRNTWCQEYWSYSPHDKHYYVQRGCLHVAYATVRESHERNPSYGWRPVLEPVYS